MNEAQENSLLKAELYSSRQLVESYRKDALAYLHALETEETRVKEVLQSEMAALRAENSHLKQAIQNLAPMVSFFERRNLPQLMTENGSLKEEVARLKRVRYAAKEFSESIPDVF